MRAESGSAAGAKTGAAHLSADRRPGRVRQGRAGTGIWGRQPGSARKTRDHRAGAGRHRRIETRRRLPEAHRADKRKSGSATRAGKTTAHCSNPPASSSTIIRTTTRQRAASIFDRHAGRAENHAGRLDRRAARLLPQPDRRRPHRCAMDRSDPGRHATRPDSLPRHGLSGLRRRHRGRRQGGAPLRRSRRPAVRLEFVLQIVLAVRRTGRRPVASSPPAPRKPAACCRN